ncbi:MAG: Maf family protein [Erysipelotrichaceae bacterium]|nr:Maf family protein [Erysipelotrichaceae bacterium]
MIILASSSPRRKELLENRGITFVVDASSIDEDLDENLDIDKRLMHLAANKAYPIHQKYPHDIVIGADTVVYYNNTIIGKPIDFNDAKRILLSLSNNKHRVYSAVAIYYGDELECLIDYTDVYFKNVEPYLDNYLQTNEWIDKAGAYGIQGTAGIFVDHIEGDIETVIGLPTDKVVHSLKSHGGLK